MKKRLDGGFFQRRLSGKKALTLLLIAALALALTGCANNAPGPASEAPETIELRLAHFFPGTHPAETDLVQPWIKALEEATEGRLLVTSYPNQTLLPADAIYDGVVTGVADIGLSCFSYTRGRFPVLEAFELPGVKYANSKVAGRVAWEGIKQLNPQEIQDTKLLMVLTTGPGDLYTKVPVRNLEDLQGLEVRATGLSAKTLEALGAVPVAMPQSEAYEALSKGVVEGNLGPVEVLQGWRQAEVTDYLTRTPFLYNTLFFITMNLDQWNSLPADMQQAIEEVSETYFENVALGLWDQQNQAALAWAVDETGMETFTLPEEEVARWIKLVEPIQEDYVAKMNQEGLPGQEILDTVQNLAEQYNEE